MNTRFTLLASLLLTTVFSAQAANYTLRMAAKGVKTPVPAESQTPAPGATTPPAAVTPPPAPTPPQVSLSPSTWNFGTPAANQAVSKTFTLANTGTVAADLAFGALSSPFSLANVDCSAKLQPQTSCAVTVTYMSPVSDNVASASLSVELGGGATALTATLQGATAGAPGGFMTGQPNVVYSNNNATISRTGGVAIDVRFANGKSSGKWYYEMQSSNGHGAVSFINANNSGYYLDFYYRDRNVFGSGVTPSGRVALSTSSTARYGFALDATARTMTIIDVTTCSVITTASWTTAGAVRPQAGFRGVDAGATSLTAYFAPSGKTCIPADYSWWTGS
jgi:hypothetical protein